MQQLSYIFPINPLPISTEDPLNCPSESFPVSDGRRVLSGIEEFP